jgi:UDP-3-O-[3-hydroxymyristoyl] glucosamine N-acyltransferase
MRLSELVARMGGDLEGNGALEITGVAGIKEAREGDITFLGHARYAEFLAETRATAVIVPGDHRVDLPVAVVRIDNPYLAFQQAMSILFGDPYRPEPGVHPSAVIAPSATLGDGVAIGPHVVVEADAVIGDGVILGAGSYVGHETTIGEGSRLYPNVVVRERCVVGRHNILHAGAIIGDDGFGLTKDGDRHRKITHIGRVILEDDVEVGSNTCVDRATMGETVICQGTRIDNLVQIAHNVRVGKNAILCAQVGVAGSSKIGDHSILAGQVGVGGHLSIGDRAQIGAQAGVIGDVPAGKQYSGYPARPHRQQMRHLAAAHRLPDLLKRVAELEERLARLEGGETDGRVRTRDKETARSTRS